MTTLLATVVMALSLGAFYILAKRVLNNVAERKAVLQLSKTLFPKGEKQKLDIIRNINHITNNRFTGEDILDYYLKIKGLQIINMNDPVDFWIRIYLMKPTHVRLNYFEQVKFYETFLNFPEAIGENINGSKYTA